MVLVIGVDGYKGGWVAVWANETGFVKATVYKQGQLDDLLDQGREAVAIGIDIPIGIPKVGPRKADVAARGFFDGLAPWVFMTPPRAALLEETFEKANALAKSLCRTGMTIYAYGL